MALNPTIRVKVLALFACLTMTTIFCGHYIIAKIVLQDIPAKSLASARGLIGGSVLCIFFYKEIMSSINLKIVGKILLLSIVAFVLNQLFFLEGIRRTAPVNAAVITNLVPVIILIFSIAFKLEKVSIAKTITILVSFFAVIFYVFYSSGNQTTFFSKTTYLGDSLILCNIMCFCSGLLLAKHVLKDVPAKVVSALMLVMGGSIMLVINGFEYESVFHYASLGNKQKILLFYELIIATSIAYFLNMFGIKHLYITTTTMFMYIQPIITALILWLVWSEPTKILPLLLLAAAISMPVVLLRNYQTSK